MAQNERPAGANRGPKTDDNHIDNNDPTHTNGSSGAQEHAGNSGAETRRRAAETTGAGGPHDEFTNAAQIVAAFLEQLRPPPWSLTAIIPDDKTTLTVVAHCAQDVADFVDAYNGSRNLYYSVNPIRNPINKKAAKTDISAIEYVLSDLDPADDETSEAAKARYSQALEACELKATGAVDSGNGIQCLWKIGAIPLGEPVVSAPDKKGKTTLIFKPEDQVKINDAEERIGALMERLGAKKGTQNIDRILRLPGTINLPNAKKLKDGRKECLTKLLWFNGAAYDIKAFPLPKPEERKSKKTKAKSGPDHGEWDKLERAINIVRCQTDKRAHTWCGTSSMNAAPGPYLREDPGNATQQGQPHIRSHL
jgi:hypothetical protein